MRNLSKLLTFLVFIIFFLFSVCCKEKQNKTLSYKTNLDTTQIIQTICFGSCNKQWEDQSYWKTIGEENPDLWIWMGDIIYCDTEDMQQLEAQYHKQKRHPEYRSFADSTQIVGVWDDHDYGVNDGGINYPKKRESRDLLFEFLDIPKSNPVWDKEGAYQSYTFGKDSSLLKVILLDGRYFKDDLKPDKETEQRYLVSEDASYLGEAQWQWFEKELKNSKAKLNLIVSGVQLISPDHHFEKWSNYPGERERFFTLIKESGVQNPLVISGDRHIAEVSKIELDSSLFLYDVTSSGLTHSYEKADEENDFRIGPLVSSKNYGKIEINWNTVQPEIILYIHQIDGEVLYSHKL